VVVVVGVVVVVLVVVVVVMLGLALGLAPLSPPIYFSEKLHYPQKVVASQGHRVLFVLFF